MFPPDRQEDRRFPSFLRGKKAGRSLCSAPPLPASHLWVRGWLCFLALPREMQWRRCKLRRAGAQRALCALNGCLRATSLACRGGNRDLEASVAHARCLFHPQGRGGRTTGGLPAGTARFVTPDSLPHNPQWPPELASPRAGRRVGASSLDLTACPWSVCSHHPHFTVEEAGPGGSRPRSRRHR